MRLLCAISHHGLGHLAQTAPVLNALHAAWPELEWLIWSGLSREALASRLALPFSHRHEPADVGLVMQDAVRVDEPASCQAYQAFHQDWDLRVDRAAGWLGQQHVDGVLSNAAYLPLAAAAQAGINAVGFSSLNWWDIAHHYLQASPGMAPAFAQMRAAYQSARAFLRLTPGLPMSWLANLEPAPALASIGRNRREELNGGLALAAGKKLVLLGFGGIAYQHPTPLPRLEGIVWLVSDAWPTRERSDVIHFERTRMPFSDLLASSDALVTKVGYGSFVEAAGLGLPVLYLDRPDWPETPWLAPWLMQHTRAMSVDEAALFSPLVGEALARLGQCPAPKLPDISGAPTIGRRIMALLGA
jgi:hypothetical protein